jgi:hypothetical protein
MLRTRGEKRLEQRRGLERPLVLLVVQIVVRAHRQGVKDPRLLVSGEVCGEFLHRLLVRQRARPVSYAGVVLVEPLQGGDEVAFALRSGANFLRFADRLGAVLDLKRHGPAERVVRGDHREAPVRHAAARIETRDFLECHLGAPPVERVIERHGAMKLLLRLGGTGHPEGHASELFLRGPALRQSGAGECAGDDEHEQLHDRLTHL